MNLRDSGLTKKGVSAVITSLTEVKPPLVFLDLSGNDIEKSVAPLLSNLLEVLPSLEELYLDDNEFESSGIMKVLPGLAKAHSLKVLSTVTCELTVAGAYSVARVVSKLPAFELYKLDGNRLADRGIDEIKSLLYKNGKAIGGK